MNNLSRYFYDLFDGVFILDLLIRGLILFIIGSATLAMFLMINYLLLFIL